MMGEITEEQLQKVREPIPFTPTKRLERDDVLYVTEDDIPHPIYGYAKYHKEYSVIDLRGYRKGYEPRLEISGIYTPDPEDSFRLQTGKLPPYQPTTTGDKLLAEMRRLGVHKAFRIGEPTPVEEVLAVPEVDITKGIIKKGDKLIANPKNIPAARAFIAELRRLADEAEQQALASTESKARRLMQNARQARKDADNIEMTIPKPPAISVVEYDRQYSLDELREKARQEGFSPSGSKKEIAARLIARGIK